MSQNKLASLLNCNQGSLSKMINKGDSFPDDLIDKIYPILGISKDEFTSWIIADKYPKETIQTAINELENNQDKTLILTKNIDKILSDKNLSRTALSKMIGYSQSGLNRMIIGQESLSKSVIARIAPILGISKETIRGWFIADKYSLVVLKLALKSLEQ